jgi:large subunit ribosomal protein L15
VVNLESIAEKFDGGEVSAAELYAARLIRSASLPVKLLGTGEIKKQFTLKVNAVSRSAKEKIEAAGGKVEVI